MKQYQLRKITIGLALFGLAILMTACGSQNQGNSQPEQSTTSETTQVSLHLDIDSYPTMDGSTANLPLMAEVMHEVCDISLEEAQELTSCSKTSQAWYNLAQGQTDILLVYEADADTKTKLAEMGVELEITAIGRDGLVFINNEKNPVNSLTVKQLQDIYTGVITNWKEVGGENLPIVAYQRRETSGSQAMFQKLLMGELQPMDAPTEYRSGDMGELIDDLASYNDTADALGFSVYYYVSQMYGKPGLQLVAVDGVHPTNDTIESGEYPFTNDFFVAIRANEPEDSEARQLYNWICSEEGKTALKTAGYVSVECGK